MDLEFEEPLRSFSGPGSAAQQHSLRFWIAVALSVPLVLCVGAAFVFSLLGWFEPGRARVSSWAPNPVASIASTPSTDGAT